MNRLYLSNHSRLLENPKTQPKHHQETGGEPQNQFNIETKNNMAKKLRMKTSFTCSDEEHMERNRPRKNDKEKGKGLGKKEVASNLTEQHSK